MAFITITITAVDPVAKTWAADCDADTSSMVGKSLCPGFRFTTGGAIACGGTVYHRQITGCFRWVEVGDVIVMDASKGSGEY